MFYPMTFLKILTSNKFHFYTCTSKHKLKLTLIHGSLLMILERLDENKMRLSWVKLWCNLPQVYDE